jgi:hypothetical protein
MHEVVLCTQANMDLSDTIPAVDLMDATKHLRTVLLPKAQM